MSPDTHAADTALASPVAANCVPGSPSQRHPGKQSLITNDVRLGYSKSMSMLSSVFNRRKGIQRKLNNFAHIRRTQSPPSPGSFTSPEVPEKPLNAYSVYNGSSASQSSVTQASTPGTQATDGSSPRVQLELMTDALSLSDWFSSELLQTTTDAPTRIPQRNASLGVTGASASQAETSRLAQDAPASRRGQEGPNERDQDDGYISEEIVGDFETDDVIVIEAPRGRDAARSSDAAPASGNHQGTSAHSKRPTPHPIKIPPQSNSIDAFLSVDPEAASSARQSPHRRSTRGSRPVSKHYSRRKSTRHSSFRKSRHQSLTRSRSRPVSRSRPSSVHSARSARVTDDESDGDGLSAVSGTTLARQLVSSYFMSGSPNANHPPSAMSLPKTRGHLARQDSATLPKGDYTFHSNRNSQRKSQRSSKGSVVSNGPTPISANYWRDRKISGDQIVVMSPEEREKEEWSLDVPPLPPMPEGLSPGLSASARSSSQDPSSLMKSVRGSLSSAVGSLSGRFDAGKRTSSSSIGSRRAGAKDLTVDPDPERKRRRVSKVSESTASVTAPSSFTGPSSGSSASSVQADAQAASQVSLPFGAGASKESVETKANSMEERQDITYERSPRIKGESSPDAPTTATSLSMSVYSGDTHGSSMFSPTGSASLYSSPGSTAVLSPGLTSIVSPKSIASSSADSASSRDPSFRSFSAARQRRNQSPAQPTITMLPIGERPRSTQVPHSPSSPNASPVVTRPQSMINSARTSLDSPDLLDIMFMGSRAPSGRKAIIAARTASPPAPISVPSRTSFQLVNGEEESPLGVKQQFPETPYAFTPLVSAGFSPAIPQEPVPPLPRSGTFVMRGNRSKRSSVSVGRKALIRSATMTSPPSSAALKTPIHSGFDTAPMQSPMSPEISPDPHSVGRLSMIEERSIAGSPISQYSRTPEPSPAPSLRRAFTEPSVSSYPPSPTSPASSAPQLDPASIPLPPSPSPLQASSPLPASTPTSPLKRKHASMVESEDHQSIPLLQTDLEDESPLPSPRPSLPPSPLALEFRVESESTEPSLPIVRQQQQLHPYGSIARQGRSRARPPPPSGPRKPSSTGNFNTLLNRVRAGSVSSVASSPSLSAGIGGSRIGTPESSSPRFQTTPVRFRPLTMEAAQWTFTSEELQSIVSMAVKQSSDAHAIRLLQSEIIEKELPEDIERLEKLSSELKTKYKVSMRKRTKLLNTLRTVAEGGELADHTASIRHLDELMELSDNLDHISEELYNVTDQLRQLTHLRDVHASSALAMAVRKLNSAFIKHLAENQKLRQQMADMQEERDEAWAQAQDVAKELEAFSEKVASVSDGVITPASSRRSSAAVVIRKASMRKNGIRSPSRLRSQRSSVATNRSSMAISPATKTVSTMESIPPVPPIPIRASLGLLTAGLSTGVSSGRTMSSSASPDEEVRALLRAQEELYEMLGIKLEELPVVRKRSMSVSDVASPPPYQENIPRPRRNSEVASPNIARSEAWHEHRMAALAAIGMYP